MGRASKQLGSIKENGNKLYTYTQNHKETAEFFFNIMKKEGLENKYHREYRGQER